MQVVIISSINVALYCIYTNDIELIGDVIVYVSL